MSPEMQLILTICLVAFAGWALAMIIFTFNNGRKVDKKIDAYNRKLDNVRNIKDPVKLEQELDKAEREFLDGS